MISILSILLINSSNNLFGSIHIRIACTKLFRRFFTSTKNTNKFIRKAISTSKFKETPLSLHILPFYWAHVVCVILSSSHQRRHWSRFNSQTALIPTQKEYIWSTRNMNAFMCYTIRFPYDLTLWYPTTTLIEKTKKKTADGILLIEEKKPSESNNSLTRQKANPCF